MQEDVPVHLLVPAACVGRRRRRRRRRRLRAARDRRNVFIDLFKGGRRRRAFSLYVLRSGEPQKSGSMGGGRGGRGRSRSRRRLKAL